MPDLPELSISYLLLLTAFVVPGAVCISVYRLMEPSPDRSLKELLLEAIVLSIINFIILFFPIYFATTPETISRAPHLSWLILIFCLIISPSIFAFIFYWIIERLNKHGIVVAGSRTAWDKFFRLHASKGCWVIVYLTDGSLIGGRFSRNSYASAFPREGHIYIQELWEIDNLGNFVKELPGPQGALLRPSDYHYLRVFKTEHHYD